MTNHGYLTVNLEKNHNFGSINDVRLAEHPNPSFQRDSYKCLNGKWEIEINKNKEKPKIWTKEVNVPYAVESPLSFVNHLLEPIEFIHYRRIIKISKDELRPHMFLHFEGVDQIAEVYVNDKFVGQHIGGYTSFQFDIRPFLKEGTNELYVRVKDVTDDSYYMRGKQKLKPSGWFYSSSSGIYKPVWLETTNEDFIISVKYTPLFDKKSVEVEVETSSDGPVLISIDDEDHIIHSGEKTQIKLSSFHPWSDEDPYLYKVKLEFKGDVVYSYFGIRKIETKIVDGQPGIYLNNKRIFINGLLDQGYYSLGGLTPKSYDDYEKDIKNIKALGYNTLRIHIKTEIPYFYYLADKYGVLLIQDFPCGGRQWSFFNVVFPRLSVKLFNKEKYCTYKRYGRLEKEGRDLFVNQASEIVKERYNNPSIIIYTIFNEAWGEFDPSENYFYFKKLDPSRIYDTASGWLDTNNSDLFSIHSYTLPARRRKSPDEGKRPYFLSEIGGSSLVIPEHYIYPTSYGHGKVKTKEALENKYKKLYVSLMPQIEDGSLNGIIYTELNDCETECNGIYTLDREVLKLDHELIKEINNEISSRHHR